jgi:hypothetical protein
MGTRGLESESNRLVKSFVRTFGYCQLTMAILGPFSIALANIAAWLPMPVISPSKHKDIADKLEAQDHANFLAPDTDPTVVAVSASRFL